LAVALLSVLMRDLRRLRVVAGLGAAAHVVATLIVVVPVLTGGCPVPVLGMFQLDGMAAWTIGVNALVYGAAMLSASLLLDRPSDLHLSEKGGRALFGLGSLFIVAANAVVSAADLGALWVAMEATTLVTAPLILLHGSRRSIEAAWKYLILCGVGIGFALLGTMVLLASAGRLPGAGLNIAWLTAHASQLKRPLVDAGFALFVLGYGTKAGLFPVHNWLPDAHSEAPAPASALLSGALLNCAMVALWRIGGIVERSESSSLLLRLLAPMGAVTVFAAGIMLVRQRELKRMWAYSSIENMGLLAVGVALRVAPIFALHAFAHSLAKCSAFLLSGNLARLHGTGTLSKLTGIARSAPGVGFALIAAGVAAMGAPPFCSFVSEWLLLAQATDRKMWGVMVLLVIGLSVSVIAVLVHLGSVVFGDRPNREQRPGGTAGSILPSMALLALSGLASVAVTPNLLTFLAKALARGGTP
jgi:hydrogenase-4 component F